MTEPAAAPVEAFRNELGPFVVAAETTRMPMIFTDAQDASNRIAFANDSFLVLTGYSREAIVGQPLDLVLAESIDSRSTTPIQSALASGSDGTWEMQCRRIDGGEFPVSVFLSPVRDKEGVLQQNFLSFVPLGARFDRLLKQRNELQALYDNAPGFIATAEGPDHRFTFANASYRKFVGREELEGLTVAEALPEIAAQGVTDILDRVFQTGEPFLAKDMAFDFACPSPGLLARRYADFVYQPVRDENGDIVGLICEGYDVTTEHEASEKLAELQAQMIHLSRVNAMGTMAITLAHELNQPLSAIANYSAGGLRLIDPGNPQAKPLSLALHAIQDASQTASAIIRSMREQTRRVEPVRSSFNLRLAIEECVRLVQAGSTVHAEMVNLVPDDITMYADRIKIQQVAINLLRNACDAVGDTKCKPVTVSAVCRDGQLVVCIADPGRGVSLDAAQDIFSWSPSTKENGMGLGLSISRTIIETHRGRIWLEASSEEGSVFCFSVPEEVASRAA